MSRGEHFGEGPVSDQQLQSLWLLPFTEFGKLNPRQTLCPCQSIVGGTQLVDKDVQPGFRQIGGFCLSGSQFDDSMQSMPARSRMLCCARCGANMPQLASLIVHTTRPLTGQSATALQNELIEDLLILRQQVPPLPGSVVLSGSSSQLPEGPAADISGSGRASPEVVADTLPKRARPQRPRLSKSLDKVGCVCQ